jgi:hypothetical protein
LDPLRGGRSARHLLGLGVDTLCMFIRYFLELPIPSADVESVLLDDPRAWLPGLMEEARDRGDRLLAEVGLGRETGKIRKQVSVELGEPQRFPSKILLPVAWRAAGGEALFPSLDADIEVASLGDLKTQLSMNARYEPPLGLVGRVIDRLLLHRVAEATIRDFLEHVATAVLTSRAVPAS